MHVETGIVLNEAELLEPPHKTTESGPCRADHAGQHFLTDFGYNERRLPFFPKWAINRRIRASRFSAELKR
jgi:hypothetical protein